MGAFSSTSYSPIAFSVDSDPIIPPEAPIVPVLPFVFQAVKKRKEVSQRVILDDGTAITIRVMDGILVDDLLVSGMKAEGYRVMTGRDTFPTIDRRIKDYLIKTGVIQE